MRPLTPEQMKRLKQILEKMYEEEYEKELRAELDKNPAWHRAVLKASLNLIKGGKGPKDDPGK